MKKVIASLSLCLIATCSAFATSSRSDLQDRMDAAKTVLDQIMAAKDHTIPMNILQQATCVAIVPSMIKGAFVFGGQYGQGVVTCKTGHGWSAPVFIRMAGGSWGFQIGGQATDLILVAVNDRGMQALLKNKFKIGGDASAAAGPVGRAGQASTDWKMSAELLSYSRNKGLFAGISLDGTSVSQNGDDTQTYYGTRQNFDNVLKGNVPVPACSSPIRSRRRASLRDGKERVGNASLQQSSSLKKSERRAATQAALFHARFLLPDTQAPPPIDAIHLKLHSDMREKLEYWLVLAVARTLGLMPRSLARLFSGVLAFLAFHLLGRLRRVGERNLDLALPGNQLRNEES